MDSDQFNNNSFHEDTKNLELKLSPNENQTSPISSRETRIELDFFKDINFIPDNDHIHTDTSSLLELKLSVSDHNSISHYCFFYLLYYIYCI